MTTAIHIQQIHKHYNTLHALDGVDFEIPQGSFFGLLGPNGAGKSTLISIMAGLIRATSGQISIMGFDVQQQWRQSRRALGVVPQELVYDPFFTVREMLRLQSGYFGFGKENHAWIDELLETLSLTDKAHANMQNLSGGMKRRVLIAQALVHKPQVIVLDEPTAGVDVELRQALWEFTRKMHAQGHTILLTTHYLEEAEALCDRIAILNHGQLAALDDKKTLLSRYPYRFLCLQLTKKPENLPDAVQQRVFKLENNLMTLRLHRQQDSISEVLESIHHAGIQFEDLSTNEPGLEEVFLDLISQAS
ncbi:ABC transporter ATP-binding protein [Candidatus Venteria ishoeyi]|uniref:ABC transporter ATP-binding protein n=1 Tax=Candidatus Venteria ishoeyi TaxID=1899563 RepID=UPI0025A54281|nr:ABC transporter ATP-binding protein [Candidatus Venteria ishoeyi]MDM8545309.1 ABC transporter ATP-binding protein [Candidatus Venteria ishoeyi]